MITINKWISKMVNKNQYNGLILVIIIFLSLIICNGISAAEINVSDTNNTHLGSNTSLISTGSNPSTPDISDTSVTQQSNVDGNLQSTSLPANYDLRTLGKLTSVKDQGVDATCWTFAALSSLESSLLPNQTWDFSENNMKNLLSNLYPNGFDRGYDDGGSWQMATAYLTSYSGPVTSAQDPYNEFSGTSPTGLKVVKHVQETVILEPRNSTGVIDNDDIKNAVMKYGAVYSLMTYNVAYFNYNTNAYYYNGFEDVNHAVDIVGWDDYYDKNNFLNGAPGNGAFIVRNSWGPYWGDGGYFYVSYFDTSLGNGDDNIVFMDAEPVTNYDVIYQYDPLGAVGYYGLDSDVGWFANIFTAKGKELLKATSFYTLTPNSSYEIYVYLNPTSHNPRSGLLALFEKGTISTAGYKTIKLDKYITLSKGEKFSIVVKLTTPNNYEPITIEYPLKGYSSKATAHYGESFISMTGISWVDMTSLVYNANVCLKAFTQSLEANLSITKKISNPYPKSGDKVLFTIKVLNNGPGQAFNVVVNDKLPQGMHFLQYITSYGSYDPKTGIWNIGTLPNGAVATIIVKYLVNHALTFSSNAVVVSSTYDPFVGNNIATLDVNMVSQKQSNLNSTSKEEKSIPMQKTGTPLIPFICALIIIYGGLIINRKKFN